eukprot:TRINITY_DN24466_c0_g1_i1.p1 TRINITY_DN24466_c0_g1~~TRINITY_DN24466_c0_g1_i1.p1  ORF type:complete len:238 (+),score=12.08 TRINITY_DN24466_c0_g1_i1:251-964(+)
MPVVILEVSLRNDHNFGGTCVYKEELPRSVSVKEGISILWDLNLLPDNSKFFFRQPSGRKVELWQEFLLYLGYMVNNNILEYIPELCKQYQQRINMTYNHEESQKIFEAISRLTNRLEFIEKEGFEVAYALVMLLGSCSRSIHPQIYNGFLFICRNLVDIPERVSKFKEDNLYTQGLLLLISELRRTCQIEWILLTPILLKHFPERQYTLFVQDSLKAKPLSDSLWLIKENSPCTLR